MLLIIIKLKFNAHVLGHLSIIKIKKAVDEDTLETVGHSALLHKFTASNKAAPCTGLSVYAREIATIGEDGRLNIIDAGSLQNIRCSLDADSCSLTSVLYVNQQELLTANRMGVIRLFDVRSSNISEATANSTAFMTSCEDEKRSNYVSCLTSHPTQQHIILAGSEEGSITVWDLRQPGFPASYLSAHTSAITEIGFHRSDPTKLFSAAEAGELWLWAQHPTMSAMEGSSNAQAVAENINPWLNGERAKNRISVTSLMSDLRKSINSFDCHGTKIICGSDNEALYCIDNI